MEEDDVVFVFVNNNDRPVTIPRGNYAEFTSTLPSGKWRDIFTGERKETQALTIDGKGCAVLGFSYLPE